jgi:glycerate-2-kinase
MIYVTYNGVRTEVSFIRDGKTAKMSYRGRVMPLTRVDIDGETWEVTHTEPSKYLTGVINVWLRLV